MCEYTVACNAMAQTRAVNQVTHFTKNTPLHPLTITTERRNNATGGNEQDQFALLINLFSNHALCAWLLRLEPSKRETTQCDGEAGMRD